MLNEDPKSEGSVGLGLRSKSEWKLLEGASRGVIYLYLARSPGLLPETDVRGTRGEGSSVRRALGGRAWAWRPQEVLVRGPAVRRFAWQHRGLDVGEGEGGLQK